jgi:hypothetical protein
MAARSPLTSPCITCPRGSSEGVSDRQNSTVAPIRPVKLA